MYDLFDHFFAQRESVFTPLCTNASSNFNEVYIFATYTHVKSLYASHVRVASYVRAQRCEKRFLSITAIHFV